MTLFKPHSADTVPKNAKVIPAGAYAFIHIALRETAGGPLVPLDTDWASVGADIFTITDPDNNPVNWNTNALDPVDNTDDYDENRSSYVGDQVTPEILGLHATLSDGKPVRLAIKLLVPAGAEQTSTDGNKHYTITWHLKKNGNVVFPSEQFNVGPAGVPVFGDGVTVTVDDIKDGISTSLTDDEIENIIAKSADWACGMAFAMCGVDVDELDAKQGKLIVDAIIQRTHSRIMLRDATAGNPLATMRKEGTKQIRYSASTENMSKSFSDDAKESLKMFCMSYNRPKARSFRKTSEGRFGSYNGCC